MKHCLFVSFALMVFSNAKAQDSIIRKAETEVIVTGFRFPQSKLKIPFTVQQIKNEGWNMQAPSMADVLQQSGLINVQKSQAGGGSPTIRGFEASRILLMVDGIRMNNAIYRAGHLQNIITVDANILQQVDILYGPSGTQYGSDALGGVVNLVTKNPVFSKQQKPTFSGNINTRYSSAMSEFQNHIDLNIGGKKWAAITSFTYSNFGDVIQGKNRSTSFSDFGKRNFYVQTISGTDYKVANKNENKQVGTAYNQTDVLQKIMFKPNENTTHLINLQLSTSTNIPRYDRLSEITSNGTPRFAEWYYGPQLRKMAAYHYTKHFLKTKLKTLKSVLAIQDIEESRYDRRFASLIKSNRIENLQLLTYNIDALINTKNGNIQTGIDLQYNHLKSKAYSSNIITNQQSFDIPNRYPDGKNNMYTIAAYIQQIYNFNENTTINYGIRTTHSNLNANILNNAIMQFPFTNITQSNSALVGNLGITLKTKNFWKWAAVISNGFRTPNFDELKVFDSRAGYLIVPNQNLKPEYSYNAEINATKYAGKFQTNLAVFCTLLKNAIQIGNTNFNGSSTINYLGMPAIVQTALNSGKGYIYGMSATFQYKIAKHFLIDAACTYTYGRIDSAKTWQPLDHIAPTYGKLSVIYKINKIETQFYCLYNSAKELKNYSSSGEDNLQYATAVGMPAWYTLNLHTKIQIQKNMSFLLGVENIFDKNYRVFASGLSAPGRNIVLAFKAQF
jgi:hemoglobin/transferrin/lactoferrin receptor protein